MDKVKLYEDAMSILRKYGEFDLWQLAALYGSLYLGVDHCPDMLKIAIGTKCMEQIEIVK